MKHSTIQQSKKFSAYVTSIVGIYLLLLIGHYAINNNIILPHPHQILEELVGLLSVGTTYTILGNTFFRLLIILSVSLISGILLGILSAIFSVLEWILHPIIVLLRTLPLISILCIVLMILGKRSAPYIITFLLLFPVIYQGIKDGTTNILKTYSDIWKMDSGMNTLVIWKVLIPLLYLYIRTALLQSVGLGLKMLVMAEYFSQTKNSIGKKIYDAVPLLEFGVIFSWTVILVVIVFVVELMLNYLLKRTEAI